jgi:hypothetical protein
MQPPIRQFECHRRVTIGRQCCGNAMAMNFAGCALIAIKAAISLT